MKKFWFPLQKFEECYSLCVAGQHMAASDQGFVWLLTPDRCREGGHKCVRLFGERSTAWQQQRTSFKPVSCDFPTQRKAIVSLKKVKLKSLAWYVLTTACCLCNTSKYFLSSHSCSVWKGNRHRVCSQWAGHWYNMLVSRVSNLHTVAGKSLGTWTDIFSFSEQELISKKNMQPKWKHYSQRFMQCYWNTLSVINVVVRYHMLFFAFWDHSLLETVFWKRFYGL